VYSYLQELKLIKQEIEFVMTKDLEQLNLKTTSEKNEDGQDKTTVGRDNLYGDGESKNIQSKESLDPEMAKKGIFIDSETLKKIGAIGVLAITLAVSTGIFVACSDKNKNKLKDSTALSVETSETIGDNETTANYSTVTSDTMAEVGETTIEGTTEVSNPVDATEASSSSAVITAETVKNPEQQIDYSIPPKNIVEGYSFEYLSADQQAEIKNLEAMSVEEFQQQTEGEQVKFAYWVYENYKGRFEHIVEANSQDYTYVENPQTAEDYTSNYAYMTAFATTLCTCAGGDSGLVFDKDTAKKFMALRDTASQAHRDGSNGYLDQFGDVFRLMDIDITIENYKVINGLMVINQYQESNKTITVEDDAKHGQRTFVNKGFSDIISTDGDKDSIVIGLCYLAVPLGDQKYIDLN